MAESVPQLTSQAPIYFPVPFHLQNGYLSPVTAAVTPVAGLVYPAVYSLPQHQQAQQLFHKDAQTITPEALATVKAAIVNSATEQKRGIKKNGIPRKAAGKTWEDPTLAEWPEDQRCCMKLL